MFGFSKHRPLLIAVSDELSDWLGREFRHAGRPCLSTPDLGTRSARLALRSAEALILTPGPQTANLIDQAANACRERRRGAGALRLVLVQESEVHHSLPCLPETACIRIEPYVVEWAAARALLARWPLHAGLDSAFGQVAHLLIAGSAPPAHTLLVQALRQMHYGSEKPAVTLASESPARARTEFLADYPQAEAIARLRFVRLDDAVLEDAPPVTTTYVCARSPEAGLELAGRLALALHERQGVRPAIHLEVGDQAPAGTLDDWDGQLYPFSYRHEACRPEVMLDGRGDELARTIHEHYRDSIIAQGRKAEDEPAGRIWEELDDSYRQASRHQADHLWAKLALSDCRALPEELVETFTFAPLEVERLAEVEHRRWAADRYLQGWRYGPRRDDRQRLHPQLVSYAELSEPMKDLDRFAIRLAPALLARYGRGLVRMLIVALVEPSAAEPVQLPSADAIDRLFTRLRARYPDRTLVLASPLGAPASRAIARRGLEQFEAGLFYLDAEPLAETLAAQCDPEARRDMLGLIVRAERRIALPDLSALERWIRRRAEILILIGAAQAPQPAKTVRLDPSSGALRWDFEY